MNELDIVELCGEEGKDRVKARGSGGEGRTKGHHSFCSHISNPFLAQDLLVSLMLEKASSSETLVSIYQSTRV